VEKRVILRHPTFPDYGVSNRGEVISYKRGKERVIKLRFNTRGYLQLSLSEKGKTTTHRVHRLVAELFIPNPDNLPEVNHIDEDKTNNNVENLEWVNRQRNQEHSLAKHYLVEEIATGKVHQVFNLKKFTEERNLSDACLHRTRRKESYQHKGFKLL